MISLTKVDTLCKKNYSRVRRRERKKLLSLFVRCVLSQLKSLSAVAAARQYFICRWMETKSVRHFLNYKRLVALARWQLLL
jgi:hypothetical protein